MPGRAFWMHQTQIKSSQELALCPLADRPGEPAVFQRAPTLMSGQAPGSQGLVRVWAPETWRLWARSLAWGVPTVTLVCLFLVFNHLSTLLVALMGLMMTSVCLFGAEVALHWPRSVTTDDAGIGISTWGHGAAFHWNEIQAVERRCSSILQPYLLLHTTQGQVVIELTAYPSQTQENLLSLILRGADLHPEPGKELTFVQRSALPPGQLSLGEGDRLS